MKLFKRWRGTRSDEVESALPNSTQPAAQPVAMASKSSARSRRPATMGRTSAEQAYLAQAALRAKTE